jgi:iron-sulfur cluster repair protein YtfE (RIC family)
LRSETLKPAVPTDPVEALAACHERIRSFSAGLLRLVALDDLFDPRVPAAAAAAHRYFAEGLPLHARDEDESLAPRLLRVVPEAAGLLTALEHEHEAIVQALDALLPSLSALARGEAADHTRIRTAAEALVAVLLPHIEREERELFPLCAALSAPDRLAFGEELLARRRA